MGKHTFLVVCLMALLFFGLGTAEIRGQSTPPEQKPRVNPAVLEKVLRATATRKFTEATAMADTAAKAEPDNPLYPELKELILEIWKSAHEVARQQILEQQVAAAVKQKRRNADVADRPNALDFGDNSNQRRAEAIRREAQGLENKAQNALNAAETAHRRAKAILEGRIRETQAGFESPLSNLSKAAELYSQANDETGYTRVMVALGKEYERIGEHLKALKAYNDAEALDEVQRLKARMAAVRSRTAGMPVAMGSAPSVAPVEELERVDRLIQLFEGSDGTPEDHAYIRSILADVKDRRILLRMYYRCEQAQYGGSLAFKTMAIAANHGKSLSEQARATKSLTKLMDLETAVMTSLENALR